MFTYILDDLIRQYKLIACIAYNSNLLSYNCSKNAHSSITITSNLRD